MTKLQAVWFKRDLRLEDNAALTSAAKLGPVLPLFVYETDLWSQPERSGRQDAFMRGALASIEGQIESSGDIREKSDLRPEKGPKTESAG